jgi:hypothetical protein
MYAFPDREKTNPISNPLLFADNRQNFLASEQIWKNKPLAAKEIYLTNARCPLSDCKYPKNLAKTPLQRYRMHSVYI